MLFRVQCDLRNVHIPVRKELLDYYYFTLVSNTYGKSTYKAALNVLKVDTLLFRDTILAVERAIHRLIRTGIASTVDIDKRYRAILDTHNRIGEYRAKALSFEDTSVHHGLFEIYRQKLWFPILLEKHRRQQRLVDEEKDDDDEYGNDEKC